jgi:xylulose-5-phosphate/fructose-6-phosphate phosphoketolase
LNDIDRFHLVMDVIDPPLALRAAYAKQALREKQIDHKLDIRRYGDDMPKIKELDPGQGTVARGATSTAGNNL